MRMPDLTLWHLGSKILTLIVSLFTSSYVYHWRDFFPDLPLAYPPVFDGRLVVYPGQTEVKDYFRWRGVDSESLRNTWPLGSHRTRTQADVRTFSTHQ